MPKTKPFDEHFKLYEEWFETNKYLYETELKALKHFIPSSGKGLEIGIGSGIFANPLGIKEGIEPSKEMRRLAIKKGLTVYDGIAEKLPVKDNSYDFVLMNTIICFVDNVKKSFLEAKRILKKNGILIIGFIDKESQLGQNYLKHKNESLFYKEAIFYSTKEVLSLLNETWGEGKIEIIQTVFGNMNEINSIQDFENGFGKGNFIVIKIKLNFQSLTQIKQ